MDKRLYIEKLIDDLGGSSLLQRKMVRAGSEVSQQAVHNWKKNGAIPIEHIYVLKKVCDESNVKFEPRIIWGELYIAIEKTFK